MEDFENNYFEYLENWEIFSYSDMSYVERILGNHHLSSYRLTDIEIKHTTALLKK